MESNKIYCGDALEVLKTFPEESINCCMTSPPYWALRDYGIDNQLGLEPTFQQYINKLCDIFDEVKRVLRKDGTLWVNIGDTYSGGVGSANTSKSETFHGGTKVHRKPLGIRANIQDKSLCNIPARFSIEMQNRGWILRNVIIWHKPNCMPSSVKDRFTVDFEYLYFFVKNKKYWFETIYEPLAESTLNDKRLDKGLVHHKSGKSNEPESQYSISGMCANSIGRNKRAVWTITTKPFKEAHFATYPEALCETPIKAGCPEFVCNKCGEAREKIFKEDGLIIAGHGGASPESYEYQKQQGLSNSSSLMTGMKRRFIDEGYSSCSCNAGFSGGIVLDPFFGAGTTGLVALKQNKKFVGIELNPKYIEIAERRLKPYLEQEKLE